jgi:hypothetical protein
MEFNAIQIASAQIHLELLSRFLYSQHPIIHMIQWTEIKYGMQNLIKSKDIQKKLCYLLKWVLWYFRISDKYNVMRGHIKRLQEGAMYGKDMHFVSEYKLINLSLYIG